MPFRLMVGRFNFDCVNTINYLDLLIKLSGREQIIDIYHKSIIEDLQ